MLSGRSHTSPGGEDGQRDPVERGVAVLPEATDEGACPVILVTRLDGRKMALNVDRIERVERNETTNDTNLYFIGGARLTVTDSAEDLVERIVEAKARVVARAFTIAGEVTTTFSDLSQNPPPLPSLRVIQPETD